MSRPSEVREPFYFGDVGHRLYGCYHPSARPRSGAPSMLICPSIGQETMRAHRALVQLAVRLSRAGSHVLRFDFFGTGDSEGKLLDVTVGGLVDDVALAVEELRRRSRNPRVALIGLRIGALAATRAAAENDLEPLALWDPVIDGRNYCEILQADHQKMLSMSYVDPRRTVENAEIVERLGFRFPRTLLAEVGQVDLVDDVDDIRGNVLLVDGGVDPAVERLASKLVKQKVNVVFKRVSGPRIWSEEPYKGLIPASALDALVDWSTERTS